MKGGDPVQKKMEEVAVYIQQHVHDGLCLEDLARQFHYSPYHLSRTFKKEMGYSIKEYMEALKIKGSIDHLVLTPQKITDTALDHGTPVRPHFQQPLSAIQAWPQKSLSENLPYPIDSCRLF